MILRFLFAFQRRPFRPLFATCLWFFLAFFASAGGFPATGKAEERQTSGWTALSEPLPIPSVLVRDVKGQRDRLKDLILEALEENRLVLLHLWAPFCPPCRPEMRALAAARPRLKAQGIAVIALAEDPDARHTVPAFARRFELRDLPLYMDEDSLAAEALEPPGIPSTYLLGPKGEFVARHDGALNWLSLSLEKGR